MDDQIETLMVEVRANTSGFQSDIEGMRNSLDTSLIAGFEQAGRVLERGLTSAIMRGKLGFDELKSIALNVMNQIASQAIQSGIQALFGGGGGAGFGGGGGGGAGAGFASFFNNLFGSLFGSPGRATGGPVAPGRAFMVGERGPELFVPTSAGRVEPHSGNAPRDVRVAINLAAPRGTDTPQMLRRSSRQVAGAVMRAMREH